MFWVLLFLFIGSTALSLLLQPRNSGTPQPSSLGDFQAPTAEEGRAIPVIFGTVKLAAPNVVWWGDLRADPIKQHAGGLFGIGGTDVTMGYKYYVGLDCALCHGPVDALVQILADTDGKEVPYGLDYGGPGETVLTLQGDQLFGGDKSEGGITGRMRFYSGTPDQPANAYLARKLGLAQAPAYGGLCHAVAEQIYVGTSQYMKTLAFVLRRCPANLGLAAGHENIGGDANPAEMIYELLTNPTWGLGITATRFDKASFRGAGETLYSEGMGLSYQIDTAASADQIISDILRHIDGVIYTDPATGLWTLKLARADYDPAAIPEFTPEEILEAPSFSRGAWDQTFNEIKINFTDRTDFTQRVAQAQETANFAIRGERVSQTLDFKGFSNAAIAQKVAIRELKAASYPLVKLRIKVNRAGWNLRLGGVFRFTWPDYGISGMACRITAINYGALEAGEIEIEAVEDIFYVSSTAYQLPAGSKWTHPAIAPQPPVAEHMEEAPYQISATARLLAAAVRADGTSTGFEAWVDAASPGTYYKTANIPAFCPSGVLKAAYSRKTDALDAAGFVIEAGADLERLVSTDAAGLARGANILVVDGEWMGWQSIADNGDGTWTVAGIARGIYDTLPADHAAGSRVWFLSDGSGLLDQMALAADETVNAKFLPTNSRGTVAIGDVAAVAATGAQRAAKPYPPGKAQVNGLYWPAVVAGDAAFSWAHRIRTAQAGTAIVQQDAASTAGTIEGGYTVEVLLAGAVKHTYADLAGTSQGYSAAQRIADDSDGAKTVQFRITPVNGGLSGPARTTDAFRMSGFGMELGQDFGGLILGDTHA